MRRPSTRRCNSATAARMRASSPSRTGRAIFSSIRIWQARRILGSSPSGFRGLSNANVNVDMIVQNVGRHGVANLTFTVPQADTERAVKALEPVLAAVGGGEVAVHEHIAKLSVVGVGIDRKSTRL